MKIKAIKFKCGICGEEHTESVPVEKLLEWVKKSPTPVFTCPKCGEDGLSHINNVHVKVLAKYIDIFNSISEALELECQKLANHGVWLEFEYE